MNKHELTSFFTKKNQIINLKKKVERRINSQNLFFMFLFCFL